MMMMGSGARVLEIREEQDRILNCYFNLASAMGLEYYYLLARRSNPRKSVHFADLIVDPHQLDESLGQMLAE